MLIASVYGSIIQYPDPNWLTSAEMVTTSSDSYAVIKTIVDSQISKDVPISDLRASPELSSFLNVARSMVVFIAYDNTVPIIVI